MRTMESKAHLSTKRFGKQILTITNILYKQTDPQKRQNRLLESTLLDSSETAMQTLEELQRVHSLPG